MKAMVVFANFILADEEEVGGGSGIKKKSSACQSQNSKIPSAHRSLTGQSSWV